MVDTDWQTLEDRVMRQVKEGKNWKEMYARDQIDQKYTLKVRKEIWSGTSQNPSSLAISQTLLLVFTAHPKRFSRASHLTFIFLKHLNYLLTAFPFYHLFFYSNLISADCKWAKRYLVYVNNAKSKLQIKASLQKRKWTVNTTCPLNASMMNWSDCGWTHSIHFCTTWFPFWSFTHFRTWPSSSFTISFWKKRSALSSQWFFFFLKGVSLLSICSLFLFTSDRLVYLNTLTISGLWIFL